MPPLPIETGDHDMGLRRQAPAVGRHSAEILPELGSTQDEIDALTARGVVFAATATKT
jgi:crotonobetainyl-CoA:carnitine CoA-transferase CaiB-like acyl-CoA transferase